MKLSRIVVFVLLFGALGFGWTKLALDTTREKSTYSAYIEAGDRNREKRLYEVAIGNYRSALAVKPSASIYDRMIDAYEAWYAEEPTSSVRRNLRDIYSEAVSAYPERVDYWEKSARYYLDAGDYTNVVSVYERAEGQGVHSDALSALYREAYYATRLNYGSYPEITRGTENSIYTASAGDSSYMTMSAAGKTLISSDSYSYIGPAGENGVVLAATEDGECFLLGNSGTKLARFSAKVVEARGIGSNLVPVRLEGRDDWCYLNVAGEEVFGGYLDAGSFESGSAPVQLSDGSWAVIGTDGAVGTYRWDEVLLDDGGKYLTGNCMIVRKGDRWILRSFDQGGAEVFEADAMDICRGGAIAFEENGKWGFVDRAGNVVFEPTYEAARSFSGGVAAVRVNGLWGFIDTSGNLVIEPVYADAGYFDRTGGTCPVVAEEGKAWQLLSFVVSRG